MIFTQDNPLFYAGMSTTVTSVKIIISSRSSSKDAHHIICLLIIIMTILLVCIDVVTYLGIVLTHCHLVTKMLRRPKKT